MTQSMVFVYAGAISLSGVGLVIGLVMNVMGFRFIKMSGYIATLSFFLALALMLLTHNQHNVSVMMLGLYVGVLIGVLGSLSQRPEPLEETLEVTRPGYRPGCKLNILS